MQRSLRSGEAILERNAPIGIGKSDALQNGVTERDRLNASITNSLRRDSVMQDPAKLREILDRLEEARNNLEEEAKTQQMRLGGARSNIKTYAEDINFLKNPSNLLNYAVSHGVKASLHSISLLWKILQIFALDGKFLKLHQLLC